jgi:O-antigen ligase
MINIINLLKIIKVVLFILFLVLGTCLLLLYGYSTILSPVVLSVLCTGCFFSFIINKPEIGILSLLFSMAFMVTYHVEMSHSLYLVYVAALFACPLYFLRHFPQSKIFWFLVLWIFLYYLSVIIFHSYEKPITSWFVINIALLSVFIWSALIKWDREKIVFITITYGSYLIVWGILEKIFFQVPRVSGPTGFATNYAIILAVLWTICFVDFCVKKKLNIFIVFCSMSVLLCIFLSGTRLGLVGMLLGIFLGLCIWFFTMKNKMSISRKIILIVGISSIFLLSIFFVWLVIPKDILIIKNLNILLSGKIDSSTLGRLTAWAAAWDAFQNNIIWGHGPNTFPDIHAIYLKKLPDIGIRKLPVAHNEILNILAETGFMGLLHISIIVTTCLFCVINHIRKNPRDSIAIAMLAAFVVLFFLMMFDASPSRGFDPWLLGVLASFGIVHDKKESVI